MKLPRLLFISLFITCLCAATFAQGSSASLRETLDWLQGKVDFVTAISEPNSFNDFRDHPRHWELVQSGSCTLVWQSVASDPKSYPQISVSFSLADLNPQKVVFTDITGDVSTGARLDLYATGGRKIFQWQIIANESTLDRGGVFSSPHVKTKVVTTKPTTNELHLNINDVDIARRMAKAYQHAITVCGGKVDPREPF
jgi:hypothetical protein